MARFGSSPRGRGTPDIASLSFVHDRFIPAWAGNTKASTCQRQTRAVHPRVGGEHFDSGVSVSSGCGSSPRGRGTRACDCPIGFRFRFIPAWAGNTVSAACASSTALVHPRVGGEHPAPNVAPNVAPGSSPRGRGTLPIICHPSRGQRFIPAWAGNTSQYCSSSHSSSVHPRVGGEHALLRYNALLPIGSSPRGRGTRTYQFAQQEATRFIPAWAGNTNTCCDVNCFNPVHPRVGGEHSSAWRLSCWQSGSSRVGGEHGSVIMASSIAAGSSPRGRGTRRNNTDRPDRHRFIPAWAGNTSSRRRRQVACSVHPRVGGEHWWRIIPP